MTQSPDAPHGGATAPRNLDLLVIRSGNGHRPTSSSLDLPLRRQELGHAAPPSCLRAAPAFTPTAQTPSPTGAARGVESVAAHPHQTLADKGRQRRRTKRVFLQLTTGLYRSADATGSPTGNPHRPVHRPPTESTLVGASVAVTTHVPLDQRLAAVSRRRLIRQTHERPQAAPAFGFDRVALCC